jgi:hypothetical protein
MNTHAELFVCAKRRQSSDHRHGITQNAEYHAVNHKHTFFVVMKSLEENQELVFIPPKDRLDLRGSLRICHKYLCRDITRYASQ